MKDENTKQIKIAKTIVLNTIFTIISIVFIVPDTICVLANVKFAIMYRMSNKINVISKATNFDSRDQKFLSDIFLPF